MRINKWILIVLAINIGLLCFTIYAFLDIILDNTILLITKPFQKDSFCNAKGLHLEGKRTPFTMQKDYIWRAKGLHLKRRKILLPREGTIATSRDSKKKPETKRFRAQTM